MDIGRIAVRALVAYVYLLFMTRAGGKRLLSEATPFDFVVSIIIGDLIDDALWAEASIAQFAAAVASIFACDAITTIGARHSRRFHRLVNGVSSIVLRDGVEDRDQLRREQLNEGDLAHLLRHHAIEKWKEVRLGIVESNHDLSVLRQHWAEPATRADADSVREMSK